MYICFYLFVHVSAQHFEGKTINIFQILRALLLQSATFKAPNLSIHQVGGSPFGLSDIVNTEVNYDS